MSRIDDDRDSARMEDRRADQLQQEKQRKAKLEGQRAFAARVSTQQQAAEQQKGPGAEQSLARRTLDAAAQAAEGDLAQEGLEHSDLDAPQRHAQEQTEKKRRALRAQQGERLATPGKPEARSPQKEGRSASPQTEGSRAKSSSVSSASASAAEGSRLREGQLEQAARRKDGQRESQQQVRRQEAAADLGRHAPGPASSAEAQEGGGTVDSDERVGDAERQGGQSGQSSQGQQGDPQSGMPGFRFNPALMAPVPVSAKSPYGDSERIRKMAQELAQRIVERVRVGTNAMGQAEFQIDLKQGVLGGMSVRVSARQGKIRAVFLSQDRNVLKALEAGTEALKLALEGRGLELEEFRLEGL